MSLVPWRRRGVRGSPPDPFIRRQAIEAGAGRRSSSTTGNVIGSPASIERSTSAELRGPGHHASSATGRDGRRPAATSAPLAGPAAGAHAAGTTATGTPQRYLDCLQATATAPSTAARSSTGLTLPDLAARRELNIPARPGVLHSQIAPVSDPGKLFPADRIVDAGPDQQPAPVAGRPNAACSRRGTASADKWHADPARRCRLISERSNAPASPGAFSWGCVRGCATPG